MTAITDPRTALEAVAAVLDPRHHATTLVIKEGRAFHLTVASRHAQLAEEIYADHRSYWWSWAEPICAIDDPHTAADKIANVLRIIPEAAQGRA